LALAASYLPKEEINMRRPFACLLALSMGGWLLLAGCQRQPEPGPTPKPAPGQPGTPSTTEEKKEEKKEGAAAVEGWGTIRGKVVYTSTPPEPVVLVKMGDTQVRDAQHCAKHEIRSEALVVNPSNKGIQWAVVWIRRAPAVHPDLAKPAQDSVELNQRGCHFIPHVLVARAGQRLIIASEDPITHNTNVSGVRNNLNVVIPAALGQKQTLPGTVVRAEPAPIPISCNIHPWMKAYLAVFDHPYFAVTNENGEFTLEKVPAGKLQLVVWQETLEYGPGGREGQTVVVEPDKTVELTIELAPKG
jgi:hypothetical protein